MKFIRTEELDQQEFRDFFEDKWQDLEDHEQLQKHGYVIEQEGKYQAYFALYPVDTGSYWLKSLYMKPGAPPSLPLTIIESAIALAKKLEATDLYVFSHQKSLNSLLSLLQFRMQDSPSFSKQMSHTEQGNWWNFKIINGENATYKHV